MKNNKPFGGLVVVLAGEPTQLPPVQEYFLWFKTPQNGYPDFHRYCIYGMFENGTKLVINNCLDHYDTVDLEHNDCFESIDRWKIYK